MITRDNEDTREFLKVEEGDNNKMIAKKITLMSMDSPLNVLVESFANNTIRIGGN